MLDRPLAALRATGATPPFGDPRTRHGTALEGFFWRTTEPISGQVVVALCGVCRAAAGDWTWLALAAEPGGLLCERMAAPATVGSTAFAVRTADGALDVGEGHLELDLGPRARLSVSFEDRHAWPRRALGGLGLGQIVPALGQYWHPHMLGARVEGTAVFGDRTIALDGATAYAEKNWGGTFPGRWWWGQAHGFDVPEVCVAFAGGLLERGPLTLPATGLVVSLARGEVLRFAPPSAVVSAEARDGAWRVRARSARHRVLLEGDGGGTEPHVLGVPVPAERRAVHRSRQHLAGRLRVEVRTGRRVRLRSESLLAGLEIGEAAP